MLSNKICDKNIDFEIQKNDSSCLYCTNLFRFEIYVTAFDKSLSLYILKIQCMLT